MVSTHAIKQRIDDFGDARNLIEEYCVAVRAAGYESFKNAPYPFGAFADGTPLPDVVRFAYRNSPALQSASGSDPFQHPAHFRELLAAKRGRLARLLPNTLRTAMRGLVMGTTQR